MATLTSKLVISLVDQVSGPARGMLAQLKALQTAARTAPMAALAAEGRRFGAATQRFSAAVSTPLGLGVAALITSTQEFEKALVGVQVAGIADNLKDGVVNFQKLREEAEATKKTAMELSEALRLSPETLLKAGEAAAKMGLPTSSLATLMKMAGSVNIQDHSLSPEQAAEFLGSMGINFKAGDKGFERGTGSGDYNADITKLANQLLGVANMTRTSAGRLQEGLRQFAPLYAGFGVTFAEASSMIGAMVQAGQLDTESGTALKSLGVRMLRPTAQGREAMLKSGIDRSQFMDLSAVSANQAFNGLMKLTDVRMGTKQRAALKKKLIEGEAGKRFLDDGWQQEFLRLYNDATGAKTAEAREANMERVLMSLTTGGGKIDMFGFMRMLAEKLEKGEMTDAQMAAIGEGRHLPKYKALFSLMPKMLELLDKTQGLKSEYTDSGNQLWRESSAGRWAGALASIQRAFVRLRESEGITNLVDSLSRLGEAIAKAPPAVVEALGKALVGLAIIGPVGLALSGTAAAITMVGSAARMATIATMALSTRLWAMTGGAVVAGLVGIASAARSAAAGIMIMNMASAAGVASRWTFIGAGLAGLGGRIVGMAAGLARIAAIGGAVTGVLGAIAAAGAFIYQNWQGLGSFFSGFADGFMKGLGPARPLIEGIASAFGQLFDWIVRITGPIDETGQKWRSWGETAGAAVGAVVGKVAELVGWLGRMIDMLSFGLASKAGSWIADNLGIGGGAKPSDKMPSLAPTAAPGPQAALGAQPPVATGAQSSARGDLAAVEAQATAVPATVSQAMGQVRSIVASVDLTQEGQRISESLANGIRAGVGSIRAAAQEAAAAAAQAAMRGAYADGGR